MAVGERQTFRTEELEERPTRSSSWEAVITDKTGLGIRLVGHSMRLAAASCDCKQLCRARDSWQQLAKHDDNDDRNLELAISPDPEFPDCQTSLRCSQIEPRFRQDVGLTKCSRDDKTGDPQYPRDRLLGT
ncbi:hypothetical protein E4U15_002867 [Claviceps sp. LM218 group G6]|nr:hypothetical protein E4U15_002867 [Claviceps sp. LM218 group G6]